MNGHHISDITKGTVRVRHGFTIVELLVVVVVVGILAAVTIVAYNGVQNSAAETALKSDLQTAAATLALDIRREGMYPSSASAADGGKGLAASNDATYEYSSVNDGKAYCLTMTSNRSGIPPYSISSDGAKVQKGVCAGHVEPDTAGNAGIAWEQGSLPAASWRSIAFGNGMFVAAIDGPANSPSVARVSSDGLSWSSPITIGNALTAGTKIVATNGHFMTVFNTGQVLSAVSAGGTTWQHTTPVPSMYSYQMIDATYGDGKYIGVRSTPPTVNTSVQTSTNGVNWTTVSTSVPWSSWSSVAYGAGRFVAVAQSGTPNIMTSEDGTTWTARAAPEANFWRSVTYANGLFVAVASSGTNRVMTSPDGITWTARAAVQANSWTSVAYGNGKFVAVASDGTDRVMTSPDGITWTARTAAQASSWSAVTYGNKCFVAVASSGAGQVMRSCD